VTEFGKMKPKMNENLKIIEYIGSYYATVDGERIWELDPSVYYVLKLCDGVHTVEEIAENIAREINTTKDGVMPVLKRMLHELESKGFITWV